METDPDFGPNDDPNVFFIDYASGVSYQDMTNLLMHHKEVASVLSEKIPIETGVVHKILSVFLGWHVGWQVSEITKVLTCGPVLLAMEELDADYRNWDLSS